MRTRLQVYGMERKSLGRAKLVAWMTDEGRKLNWLAAKAMVDRGAAGRWMRGISCPHPRTRVDLEEITRGAVKASDWEVEE